MFVSKATSPPATYTLSLHDALPISQNPEEFKALYAYSPLHHLKRGVKYPATLITTADHDDRVVPAHSFKFAAGDRKSTRLNSSHQIISYAVFCLKKKKLRVSIT